jgi:hypothetical protein
MLGTKRIFNQAAGMRLYLRPQCLAYQDRRAVPYGSLAGPNRPCHHRFSCPHWLACIQALAGYGTMVGKKRSGL